MGELTVEKLMELRDKYSKRRVDRLILLREAILSGPEEATAFCNKKKISVSTFRTECQLMVEEGVWPL